MSKTGLVTLVLEDNRNGVVTLENILYLPEDSHCVYGYLGTGRILLNYSPDDLIIGEQYFLLDLLKG